MWSLPFISEEDFTQHVKITINKYGDKLKSFDLKDSIKTLLIL